MVDVAALPSRQPMFAGNGARTALSVAAVEVIAPAFKRRLSGVTSTLVRLLPVQMKSLQIATVGIDLAATAPRLPFVRLAELWQPPTGRRFRIWHARRNTEMAVGILLRDLLRMPLALVFTSASQRHHTWTSRFMIGRMDAVISTSAKTAAYLRRPSAVIPHGIDPEAFHPAADIDLAKQKLGFSGEMIVGCFGRVRHQKGTDVFVDAMIKVLPEIPGARALVLGRTTKKHEAFLRELRRRVAAAGLEDRIIFRDEVPPGATPDWYRALDLLVAPQRWEGFGVTPLEAAASGVPVIATTAGAFQDLVVDGTTGLLIPPSDIDAMAAAVRRLMGDARLRTTLGKAARARAVESLTIGREAEQINAVYRALWDGATISEPAAPRQIV